MVTLHTFGDSILDCGHYNAHGLHPAGLMAHNDDALFPEFKGRDLASLGPVKVDHRAVDGARVDSLARQIQGASFAPDSILLVTIGGNDLLGGLVADRGPGIEQFRHTLENFLGKLPPGRVLLGNVYDPTFGNDAHNFLPVDPSIGRPNLRRMNATLAVLAQRHGRLVDVHGHFLRHCDPSWHTHVIEPSLTGASEIRRIFLDEAFKLLPT